jgi:small subunit ribosomal protein S8
MNDPIADLLTRIRNAVHAGHTRVDVPHSKMKLGMAEILKREGYILNVEPIQKGGFPAIRITLRYDNEGEPLITGITMVSRPGKRVYSGHGEIPNVLGGIGLNIISTSRGLMTGREARKSRVGGEIVCNVW